MANKRSGGRPGTGKGAPRPGRPRESRGPAPASAERPEVGEDQIETDFHEFAEELTRQGQVVSKEAIAGLRSYGQIVISRSRVLNLVGQADRPRFFSRHVAECLAPALLDMASRSTAMVDIGSGGGLPGIPIAICCPDLQVTLVEPRLRKAQFLESATSALGLAGRVHVYHGTAESFGRDQLARNVPVADRPDLVTARAVDRLPVVWSWALNILAPRGWLAVFKGPAEVEGELAQIDRTAPRSVQVVGLPDRPRVVVFLQA